MPHLFVPRMVTSSLCVSIVDQSSNHLHTTKWHNIEYNLCAATTIYSYFVWLTVCFCCSQIAIISLSYLLLLVFTNGTCTKRTCHSNRLACKKKWKQFVRLNEFHHTHIRPGVKPVVKMLHFVSKPNDTADSHNFIWKI